MSAGLLTPPSHPPLTPLAHIRPSLRVLTHLEVTEEAMHRQAPAQPMRKQTKIPIIISNHNVSTSRCTATARTQARKKREREPPLSSPFHLPLAPLAHIPPSLRVLTH